MAKKPVKYYVVDAFTEVPFKGNPAAVCFLEEEEEMNHHWLQAVAAEFNISQTCFLTRIVESDNPLHSLNGTSNPRFRLRWFTPITEVKLCGHATLAAAHTLFSSGLVHTNIIEFVTLSGLLTAKRIPAINFSSASNLQDGETEDGFYIELDFPADPVTDFKLDQTSLLSGALMGASIIDIRRTQVTDDLLVILKSSLFHIYCRHDKYFPENRISLRDWCMRKTIFSSLYLHAHSFYQLTCLISEEQMYYISRITFLCKVASVCFEQLVRTEHYETYLISYVVVKSGENVTEVKPQLDAIVKCPGRGIIVSGIAPPGSKFDFYSRFFCPKFGINEDPACGTAHCSLACYWSKKLGKYDLNAYQASPRGAIFNISLDEQNQRVLLRGKAVTVMEGCILV